MFQDTFQILEGVFFGALEHIKTRLQELMKELISLYLISFRLHV